MNKSSTKKFLIDGFPRNENNLQGWHKVMDGKADVKCVLFFECTEEVRTLIGQSICIFVENVVIILRTVATFWAMSLVGIYPGRASIIMYILKVNALLNISLKTGMY